MIDEENDLRPEFPALIIWQGLHISQCKNIFEGGFMVRTFMVREIARISDGGNNLRSQSSHNIFDVMNGASQLLRQREGQWFLGVSSYLVMFNI